MKMKKSILLGAAALAAIALAAPQAADAGETKIGGYYQFRTVTMDNTPGDVAGDENANYWAQRLQLNVDMKASEKSHAHLVTRVLNNNTVGGADVTLAGDWTVNQLWLETEAWNVGLKVGNMPIALNDGLLFNHDTTSYGTILLAKNFGGVTVVGANVKVAEGSDNVAPALVPAVTGPNANHQDVDFWVLSALGKYSNVDYQITAAYLNSESRVGGVPYGAANGTGVINNATDSITDGWIALTLGGKVENVDLTGTLIYETGMDNVTNNSQLDSDGFMAALRAKGKTGFGGWNGYVFYGAEDFTAAVPGGDRTFWSPTWDQGGAGAQDLMQRALVAPNGGVASTQSNMWGVGAGLTINAGAWTIKPSLDYASLVEEVVTTAPAAVVYDSAMGGTIGFTTKIQEGTMLDLSGTFVDPNARVGGTSEEVMHYVQASVKMDF
ncbi:MAG: hypothetical protein HQM00_12275 [Magnetococcales bacterium]|nr:hypothetical protein [Magnetococcales bacterium]